MALKLSGNIEKNAAENPPIHFIALLGTLSTTTVLTCGGREILLYNPGFVIFGPVRSSVKNPLLCLSLIFGFWNWYSHGLHKKLVKMFHYLVKSLKSTKLSIALVFDHREELARCCVSGLALEKRPSAFLVLVVILPLLLILLNCENKGQSI